jgi:homogentisate 1,2-dioxygenase
MSSDFKYHYQNGFGNQFSSEAVPGALPKHQNSPKHVPFGLYAEQLSGSAFTAPRAENLRTWVYRIRPAAVSSPAKRLESKQLRSAPLRETVTPPDPMRWDPVPIPTQSLDFVDGLTTLAACGDVEAHKGSAIHLYFANVPMSNRYFYNADGELLIVPQEGHVELRTELGRIGLSPGEIAVIPCGIRFQVHCSGPVRGYICENYGVPFRLPYLGVVGANGLADPRHFEYPQAAYEERSGEFEIVSKFLGNLFSIRVDRSPLDVVAWHGNYAPYKYDLARFQSMQTVSFDHGDPSIFTVLTSVSEHPGIANVDFVLFSPRWMVAENSFRPPWFHRNCMSEYMGLIKGVYDARERGFLPGGGSLHNCMTGHGPDAATFEKAISEPETPRKIDGSLAFMFESSLAYKTTDFALKTLQKDYLDCWKGLKAHFNPNSEGH